MKRKLLALAIAGGLWPPIIAQADDSTVTLTGVVNGSMEFIKRGNDALKGSNGWVFAIDQANANSAGYIMDPETWEKLCRTALDRIRNGCHVMSGNTWSGWGGASRTIAEYEPDSWMANWCQTWPLHPYCVRGHSVQYQWRKPNYSTAGVSYPKYDFNAASPTRFVYHGASGSSYQWPTANYLTTAAGVSRLKYDYNGTSATRFDYGNTSGFSPWFGGASRKVAYFKY